MPWTLKLLRQVAILSVIYWLCKLAVNITGIPVPANVLGIVVLFCLLMSGVVKEEHISLAADILLRHLVFFFVPIAVALMNWGEVFYSYGWVLLVALLVSSLVPLIAVPFVVHLLKKRGR